MSGEIDCCWLAWFAGFVDGEGSVNISGSTQQVGFCVCNMHRPTIEEIQAHLGGRLSVKSTGRQRPIYYLYWKVHEAVEVLKMIEPFLVTKKRQAQLIISYPFLACGKHPVPPEVRARRREIVDEIRVLKQSPTWRQKRTWSQASNSLS